MALDKLPAAQRDKSAACSYLNLRHPGFQEPPLSCMIQQTSSQDLRWINNSLKCVFPVVAPVPLALCKHAQAQPRAVFFSTSSIITSSKGQLPMPEFIKLSLKKVRSLDGRCSPLMGSPASRSFWAPTGAVWPSWLLGCRRAQFCANKQPSVQGQLPHSRPSAPFEAWGVSELGLAVVGCEGKGFIVLRGVSPGAFSCLLQTCDPTAWLSGQDRVLFNWNQGQVLLWRCPFQYRLEPGSSVV